MISTIYGVPSEVVVRWILEKAGGADTWVDLGCGNGDYLRAIGWVPSEGLGVDLADPEQLPQSFTFEKMDIHAWLAANAGKAFGVASMFDVVEHFPKGEALSLIAQAKLSARAVLISTPSGFLKQDGETDPSLAGNPWLWHRCGFSAEEFEQLGFAVLVLKNAHIHPAGNDRSFDKLIAYSEAGIDAAALLRSIRRKAIAYNLIPLHLYRTLRDNLVRA